MSKLQYLGLLLAASSVCANDLKDIAAHLNVPENLNSGQATLALPDVPAGVTISISGVDFEELITDEGKISPVISKVPVAISYELRRGAESVISPDYIIDLQPQVALNAFQKSRKPPIIPEPLQWRGAEGEWQLPASLNIIGVESITESLATALKQNFGVTNAQDKSATKRITATLTKTAPLGSEGYRLVIGKDSIDISASSETGLAWGANSLLQALKSSSTAKSLPCGEIIDIPRYPVRGFMLDVARSPVPLSRLYELVDQLAWYKMNELQIHLNDNFIFHEHYVDAGKDPFQESYAGYRLESSVRGKDGTPLTSQDLFYTKEEMGKLINYAKSKGVKIIPEFDTPGHALSFTRVRPDLIYQGPMGGKEKRRCEMLDAGNPETLKFVSDVLDEYLTPRDGTTLFEPGTVVHIGADEFYGQAEDYRKYTDGILRYVKSRGYKPRVWGSLSQKRGKTPIISEGVEVSLWNHDWSGAWETINQGFDVINMNDGALYIVPLANYYRMDNNLKWIFQHWKPNQIGKDLIPAGHPQLKGAMFALWNDEIDLLHHGHHYDDYAQSIDDSIGILGHKMWAPDTPLVDQQGNPLSLGDYQSERLSPLGIKLAKQQEGAHALGLSKRNIPAGTELNLASLQPPYHLTMRVKLDSVPAGQEQILLKDADGGVLFAADKDGKVAILRDDTLRFQWDAVIPTGRTVTVELIGKLGRTALLIDGKEAAHHQLKLLNFNTTRKKLFNTFRLPLGTVAPQLNGQIESLDITPVIPRSQPSMPAPTPTAQ